MLKTIHSGCNTSIFNKTTLKLYHSGLDSTRELDLPLTVALDDHNIHLGIVQALKTLDKSGDNPYRLLEQSDNY